MTELAVLTAAETDVLADCEETISHGLQTFVEVGTALSLIRDNRLYRASHQTFEAYCQERWQLSRPRAYELMTAAVAVSGMPDTDRPANARQAVELARVPEPQRAEVWQAANDATDGKPTAAAIRAAATPTSPVAEGEPATGDTPIDPDEAVTEWRRQFGVRAEAVREGRESYTTFAADFPPDAMAVCAGPYEVGLMAALQASNTPAPVDEPESEERRQPNRKPLPDAFQLAAWDLVKVAERLERLVQDDRFPRNAEQVGRLSRHDLLRAGDLLATVVDRVPNPMKESTE
jgi:hypothetical protein